MTSPGQVSGPQHGSTQPNHPLESNVCKHCMQYIWVPPSSACPPDMLDMLLRPLHTVLAIMPSHSSSTPRHCELMGVWIVGP